jgi:hypothetical protein
VEVVVVGAGAGAEAEADRKAREEVARAVVVRVIAKIKRLGVVVRRKRGFRNLKVNSTMLKASYCAVSVTTSEETYSFERMPNVPNAFAAMSSIASKLRSVGNVISVEAPRCLWLSQGAKAL